MENTAETPQSRGKEVMPESSRPGVDPKAVEELWGSHRDTNRRVGALETQVGVIVTEVHHARNEIQDVSEKQDAGFEKISAELSARRSPNWQMLQVLGPTLFSILAAMWFVFYREIDHTRREIDHVGHIQNLKSLHQAALRESELNELEWKMRYERSKEAKP